MRNNNFFKSASSRFRCLLSLYENLTTLVESTWHSAFSWVEQSRSDTWRATRDLLSSS